MVAALDEVEIACFPIGSEGDLLREFPVHFPDRNGVAGADLALIAAVIDGARPRADGGVCRRVAAVDGEQMLPRQRGRVAHALDRLGERVLERGGILVGELSTQKEGIAPVCADGPAERAGLLGAGVVQRGVRVHWEGVLGAQVDGGGARRFTTLQDHGVLHEGILVENGHIVEQAAAVDVLAGLGPQGGEQLPLPKPLRTRGDLAVERGLDHRNPEDATFVVDGRGIHEHQGPLVPEVEL